MKVCNYGGHGERSRRPGRQRTVLRVEAWADSPRCSNRRSAPSQTCARQEADLRRYWASILFARVCTSGVSLLWLCPGSHLNHGGYHWDFGSVASLTRNIFECSLSFYYLGIEAVGTEEWDARLGVMNIHDYLDRLRMLRHFEPGLSTPVDFDRELDELREKPKANAYFLSLPDTKRKKLLNGEQFCILTQDEILQRMGSYDQRTRGLYRFLSAHTHSFPLAFYRMREQRRGNAWRTTSIRGTSLALLTSQLKS